MSRVVHFDIYADDPERAMRFYSDVLGWKFEQYFPDYWGVITGDEGDQPGINGGLSKREGPRPEPGSPMGGFVCVAQVDDVDASMAKAVEAGGSEATAKHAIPGVGYAAYFYDTEGNMFGLWKDDPSAA